MRVVIDINILVSALIVPTGQPAAVIRMWLDGKFTLLTCAALAEDIDPLPHVGRSSDPDDDYLLVLSEAGNADYLVTGDKNGLLDLDTHKGTRIISARDFAALFA